MSYYLSFSMPLFLSLVAFAALLPSPTLSTSLAANVTGKDGEFFVHLLIGTPPTLGRLFVDTESDLIWTQHRSQSSTSYSKLGCSSVLCKKSNGGCNNRVCQYKYQSTNLSTFQVDLGTDTFKFRDTVSTKLIFSCGALENVTGGLGLGHGPLSLVSQTNASKFSYCLPDYDDEPVKRGFLLIGSLAKSNPNMIYTSLNINKHKPSRYYISAQRISVNGFQLNIPTSAFEINGATGAGGIIMDSGTTMTQFNDIIYTSLVNRINSIISLKRTTSPPNVDLPNCYLIPPNNIYKLPRITIHFSPFSILTLSPANTFRVYSDSKTNKNVSCLAIARSPSSDNGMSRLGNLQQLNTVVFFDLAKQRVGFLPSSTCDAM